jgi:hypothetical protein
MNSLCIFILMKVRIYVHAELSLRLLTIRLLQYIVILNIISRIFEVKFGTSQIMILFEAKQKHTHTPMRTSLMLCLLSFS